MGNTYITAKTLLDDLDVSYTIPPFNNKKALELGARFVPEMACLPLKMTLGNLIQGYAQGADTVLMVGGCGPCRLGYYCEMQREILKDIGYKMDFITLEPPDKNIGEFIRRIEKLTGNCGIGQIIKAVKNAVQVSIQVDELERLCFRIRPREIKKGYMDKVYSDFQNNVLHVSGSHEIKRLIKKTAEEIADITVDMESRPLKIGIVGEIYTTIDTYTSFEIQLKLGKMGAEVERSVTLGGWIVEHILKKIIPLPGDLGYAEAAKPYLRTMIGGHAQETIGNTILYAKRGFDGVVQIYPLTCMPEIVAESILPSIERDFDIPILTLIIDEMTGETGYLTRVEAFVDMLLKRREKRTVEGKWALSRN